MPTRISSGGVLLPSERVRSQSVAAAEVIRSLAGRAAELYEYATGESCLTDHPPITPSNPQGLTGWDWSGPPWGSAVLHPIAWVSNTACSTGAFAPDITDQTERRFGLSYAPARIVMRAYIRPHDILPSPSVAPYSRVCVAIRTERISGTTTPTATIRAWNEALQTQDQAATASFTTTISESTQQFANNLKVPVRPGDVNSVTLEIQVNGTGDTSAHYVSSVLLYNSVKRSH
jgi:hypothetical protein